MIGLPLTGWLVVSASKTNIPTLLYGVVPWPHIPGVAELASPAKAGWHRAGEVGHGLLAKLTYLLLAVHVGGALKHQWLDRDATLARMIPGVRAGAWLDPRGLLAAAVLIAAIAGGQCVPAPDTSPRGAAPHPVTAWTVDPGGKLEFATSWSGQPVTGQFRDWSADIRFSEDDPAGSRVTVTIDPASVATGDAQRDATLPTEDWLDTAGFPKATFQAEGFRHRGATWTADGRMTLKGVSRPLRLTFTLDQTGDRVTARGQTVIDRTAFGVGKGDFAATDQIPAQVTVRFAFSAHRPATR